MECKGCIWNNSHASLTPQGPGAETKAEFEAALPASLSFSLIVPAHSPPHPRNTSAGHFIRYTLGAESWTRLFSRAEIIRMIYLIVTWLTNLKMIWNVFFDKPNNVHCHFRLHKMCSICISRQYSINKILIEYGFARKNSTCSV